MLNETLQQKYEALQSAVTALGSVAVAFSGGVDSTLLLKVAHDQLGSSCVAVTGKSPSVPAREIREARAFCETEGIRHVVVETHEYDIPGFDHNPENRCYLCKKELFTQVSEAASTLGVAAIAEGSNMDDLADYRPGFKAVEEMRVASPLREAGLFKQDIRDISRELGLPTWNKPSFACLNTRFAYGDLITSDRLAMVDAAEQLLLDLGFRTVRVRLRDETARIEVAPEDIARLAVPATRKQVVPAFKNLGFTYVSVDLEGYRSGSMNATLG